MRWVALLAGAAGVLCVLAAPAGASELSWDGPTECAQAEQLLFQIERALGTPLEQAGKLEFRVRVEAAGAPASARLSVASPEPGSELKQRLLVAANCTKLVDTLAVAVSLIIGDAHRGRRRALSRANAASAQT